MKHHANGGSWITLAPVSMNDWHTAPWFYAQRTHDQDTCDRAKFAVKSKTQNKKTKHKQKSKKNVFLFFCFFFFPSVFFCLGT